MTLGSPKLWLVLALNQIYTTFLANQQIKYPRSSGTFLILTKKEREKYNNLKKIQYCGASWWPNGSGRYRITATSMVHFRPGTCAAFHTPLSLPSFPVFIHLSIYQTQAKMTENNLFQKSNIAIKQSCSPNAPRDIKRIALLVMLVLSYIVILD